MFAAHMDTVFPAGTNVKVRREAGRLYAPGVGDNSTSVANLLQVIRAMRDADMKTRGDIVFLATVQEEVGLAHILVALLEWVVLVGEELVVLVVLHKLV